MPSPSFEAVRPVVVRLTGQAPVHARSVDAGAYSDAGRWVVEWEDGSTAFVKAEDESSFEDDHGLWLEALVSEHAASPAVPRFVAYEPGGGSVPRTLVVEDLSHARWGVPLDARSADLLSEAIEIVASTVPPKGLPPLRFRRRWPEIASEPAAVIATGLFDAAWIETYADRLVEAEASASLEGEELVHTDTWLQNWCRTDVRAVLVDWAGAAIGTTNATRAWGEAGVRAAGGPPGRVLASGAAPWAAWMAGLATSYLVSSLDDKPVRLAETECREVVAALGWACEELEITPPPTTPNFLPAGPWRP